MWRRYHSWGRVPTCEENTQDFYFKKDLNDGLGWNKYDKSKKRDYGWVVEIDPETKSARKLSALGRFAHEGATVYAKKVKKLSFTWVKTEKVELFSSL